jgi:L-amino acid N-acyltransferase YncA
MASSQNTPVEPARKIADLDAEYFPFPPKEKLLPALFPKKRTSDSSQQRRSASVSKVAAKTASGQPLPPSESELSRIAQEKEFQDVSLISPPADDFIDTYIRYADVIEAPPELHEGVALSLVAATLNYNGVTIQNGSACSPLDFWYVLLTPSGGGRNTAVRTASKILDRAGMDFLLRTDAFGSTQAMYQEFSLNPRGFRIWGEMSEKLKELADTRFGNAKAWLTDRYDEFRAPDDRRYRKTGREDKDGNSLDTPDIVFPEAPRTNFLATSAEPWFFQYLSKGDSAGGFVPRWMIQKAKSTGVLISTPKPFDESLLDPVAVRLREIAELQGEADISAILPRYKDWYQETHARFNAQPNSSLAMPFWHRHRVHILKVAVVYEASSSATLKISEHAWDRAVAKARQLEETIFGYLDTDMSGEGYKLKQMEERVREAGKKGLPRHEFTSAFKTDQFREQKLRTLCQARDIFPFRLPSKGGRPPEVLVHRDFLNEFLADYLAANGGTTPAPAGCNSEKQE